MGACVRLFGMGLVLAGGRSGSARLLGERGLVRRRTAPRHRRLARKCFGDPRAHDRRSDLRGAGANERPDGDDLVRRVQGLAHASRDAARPTWRFGRRGRRHRRAWADRGSRARCCIRPPRCPARFVRDVRRSALAPSASGRLPPSTCARGAARTTSCGRPCAGDAYIGEPVGAGGRPGSAITAVAGRLRRSPGVRACVEWHHRRGRDSSRGLGDRDRRHVESNGRATGTPTTCGELCFSVAEHDDPSGWPFPPGADRRQAPACRPDAAAGGRRCVEDVVAVPGEPGRHPAGDRFASSRPPALRAGPERRRHVREHEPAMDGVGRASRRSLRRRRARRSAGRAKGTPYHWRP